MTDREKAIVMAYTGYCMLAGDKLKVFYEYVGELLGRPVYTHEFADPDIQEKAADDFYKLCRETTPEETITQKDWADYWHKLSQSYAHTICVMAEAIAQHGVRQWIPCSERLPKKPKNYPHCEFRRTWFLVSLESGCVKSLAYEFDRDEWQVTGSPVLAWMPLPKPYGKGKVEGEPIPQWRGCMDGCLPFQEEE